MAKCLRSLQLEARVHMTREWQAMFVFISSWTICTRKRPRWPQKASTGRHSPCWFLQEPGTSEQRQGHFVFQCWWFSADQSKTPACTLAPQCWSISSGASPFLWEALFVLLQQYGSHLENSRVATVCRNLRLLDCCWLCWFVIHG